MVVLFSDDSEMMFEMERVEMNELDTKAIQFAPLRNRTR